MMFIFKVPVNLAQKRAGYVHSTVTLLDKLVSPVYMLCGTEIQWDATYSGLSW